MFATSVYDGTTLSAPAFEIRWRTEDLELMPPFTDVPTAMGNPTTFATSVTPAPGDRRGSSTSSLLSSPPGQDEDDEDTPAESGSLSTGSVAGIAIGASVGVLGMSMTALFILSRRRRRQDAEEARRQSEATPTVSSSGLAAAFQRPPVELEDQRSGPTELAADSSTIYRGRLDEEQRDDPVHPEPSIFTAGSAQRNRNV